MKTMNSTLYEELTRIQCRCDEYCESCDDYDEDDEICKWEEAVGGAPCNWTLGKLRMNAKELEIMNVFEANSITRIDGKLLLRTRGGESITLTMPDTSAIFAWLKEEESEVI